MNLCDVADQYGDRFLKKYSHRFQKKCLLPSQLKALKAIQSCRTPASGMTLLECNGCGARDHKPMSWRASELQPLPEYRHQRMAGAAKPETITG